MAAADAPAPEAPPTPIYYEEAECPVCMEIIDGENGKAAKPWPTPCQHRLCESCWKGCINYSLKCPLCRAEAPASARPTREIDREVVLSIMQRIRLQELERLRMEAEARRRPRRLPTIPSTRAGRFISRRVAAVDSWLDSLVSD